MRKRKCRHDGDRTLAYSRPYGSDGFVVVGECCICDECGAWLPLGKSNDDSEAVREEIRAAMLDAGYETANDTDDVLADPVTRRCIEHMLGCADLDAESAPVFELAEVMRTHHDHQERDDG